MLLTTFRRGRSFARVVQYAWPLVDQPRKCQGRVAHDQSDADQPTFKYTLARTASDRRCSTGETSAGTSCCQEQACKVRHEDRIFAVCKRTLEPCRWPSLLCSWSYSGPASQPGASLLDRHVIYRGPWLLTFRLLIRLKIAQLGCVVALALPVHTLLSEVMHLPALILSIKVLL